MAGEFSGNMKVAHKSLWIEFHNSNLIVSEMEIDDQMKINDGYFFTPRLINWSENMTRDLNGARIEMKFLGQSDPFCFFTIGRQNTPARYNTIDDAYFFTQWERLEEAEERDGDDREKFYYK